MKEEIKQKLSQIKEARLMHTMEFFTQLKKIPFIKRWLKSSFIVDGSAALFAGDDGEAYEIVVRPARYAQHKAIWGDLLKRKEDREE